MTTQKSESFLADHAGRRSFSTQRKEHGTKRMSAGPNLDLGNVYILNLWIHEEDSQDKCLDFRVYELCLVVSLRKKR